MFNSLDTLLIFTILAAFNLWGGAAIGAGVRGRRALPVLWGILIGGAPLYFGVERLVTLRRAGSPLACQIACLVGAALAVGLSLPRLRAFFLQDGMAALMIGTFIMAAAAVLGAWLLRSGAEILSLLVGGVGFLFGAMWFGAGIQQLRREIIDYRPSSVVNGPSSSKESSCSNSFSSAPRPRRRRSSAGCRRRW